jgi:hypothetical protein
VKAADQAAPLRPLDIAAGIPLGRDRAVPALPRPGRGDPPVAAMERVLRGALGRPPCVISFSGGRDSSALLAVAVDVARRDGLDLPIPATLQFPGDAAADEDAWQRLVIGHLGLSEWIRIEIPTGQLDAVGPVAATVLGRHGLLWPFNAHFHFPIIEAARGGTVVTGFGGDELGRASASARAERIVTGRQRVPFRLAVPVVGLAAAPAPVRAAVHRRRAVADQPWLTARGVAAARRAAGRDEGRIPFGWERKVRRWIWPSRYFRVCQHSFAVMGRAEGVDVVHPFVAPAVLASLAAAGGVAGFGGRDDLMDRLFAHVLPVAIRHRQSKATFTDPLWTELSREFAGAWSGEGVDHAHIDTGLVDVERLRTHWQSEDRDLLSTTLLQAAWLGTHRQGRPVAPLEGSGRRAEPLDGGRPVPPLDGSGQLAEPLDQRGHGRVGRRPVPGPGEAHHRPGDEPEPRPGVVLREA